MSRPVIYMCHPVSKTSLTDPDDIHDFYRARNYTLNCLAAEKWLAYLIMTDRTKVYIAPWLSEVRLATTKYRGWGDSARVKTKPFINMPYQEALKDDEEIISRCNGVILTGGFISKGMQQELDRAIAEGKPFLDITGIARPNIAGRYDSRPNKALEMLLQEWKVPCH